LSSRSRPQTAEEQLAILCLERIASWAIQSSERSTESHTSLDHDAICTAWAWAEYFLTLALSWVPDRHWDYVCWMTALRTLALLDRSGDSLYSRETVRVVLPLWLAGAQDTRVFDSIRRSGKLRSNPFTAFTRLLGEVCCEDTSQLNSMEKERNKYILSVFKLAEEQIISVAFRYLSVITARLEHDGADWLDLARALSVITFLHQDYMFTSGSSLLLSEAHIRGVMQIHKLVSNRSPSTQPSQHLMSLSHCVQHCIHFLEYGFRDKYIVERLPLLISGGVLGALMNSRQWSRNEWEFMSHDPSSDKAEELIQDILTHMWLHPIYNAVSSQINHPMDRRIHVLHQRWASARAGVVPSSSSSLCDYSHVRSFLIFTCAWRLKGT
jgi:hypothetical protein